VPNRTRMSQNWETHPESVTAMSIKQVLSNYWLLVPIPGISG